MRKNDYIIIPAGPSITPRLEPISEELYEKHRLPIFLARCLWHLPLELLLTKPTDEILPIFAQNIQGVPDFPRLLEQHKNHFPDTYVIPSEVSTYALKLVYDLTISAATKAHEEGRTFDGEGLKPTLVCLLKTGANPMAFLSNKHITAEQMERYLQYSPPKAAKDLDGYSLAHAHWAVPDFMSQKLPVFLKYGINMNSAQTEVGTVLHLLLANEWLDKATDFLNLTKGLLDPSVCDGEKKTVPIIAAKVHAEAILLLLADLYPDNLALNTQDNQGRTVMHYCCALGLIEAAHRYADLGADLKIQDLKLRTPLDYLALSDHETFDILYSIEIHGDRDSNAKRNAIMVRRDYGFGIKVNGAPVLARVENFTDELFVAARLEAGEEGVAIVEEQRRLMSGLSLIESVAIKRKELKQQFDDGIIVPRTGTIKNAGSPRVPSA